MSARHPASGGSGNRRWLVASVALVVASIFFVLPVWDAILSGLLTVEVFRPLRPGPVMWVTRSPQEVRVTFPGRQRMMDATSTCRPAAGGERGWYWSMGS